MFRLFTYSAYEQLVHQYTNIVNNITLNKVECFNCNEKLTLLDQIADLNTVIETLHERIRSLTQIRLDETEIDDLSAQFASVKIGDLTIAPETGAEVTLHPSTLSNCSYTNDTSVWSNTEANQSQSESPQQHTTDSDVQNPTVVTNILNSIKENSADSLNKECRSNTEFKKTKNIQHNKQSL